MDNLWAQGSVINAIESGATIDSICNIVVHDPSLLQIKKDSVYYPIHVATASGRLDVLGWLLDSGTDIESLTDGEVPYTPLAIAVDYQQQASVEYLIRRGANPEVRVAYGRELIELARLLDDQKITKLLQNEIERRRNSGVSEADDSAQKMGH